MTCIISLISNKTLKIIKTQYITKDTYIECEDETIKMNNNLKSDKNYWTITAINV